MMNKERIYKNIFTLELKNNKAESEFQKFLQNQKLKTNKYFSAFLLALNIVDVVLQNVLYEQALKKPVQSAPIYLYTSFCLVCISLPLFIFGFFISNSYFQIFISYVNYIFISFSFINIREVILGLKIANERVLDFVVIIEDNIRDIMIIIIATAFPHGLYMNLTLVGLFSFYLIMIKNYYSILNLFLSACITIILYYYYTKYVKEKFLIQLQKEEQRKWYFNLFEHLHSGFISFNENNKINIINNSLLEVLYENKEVDKLLQIKNEVNGEREEILSNRNRFIALHVSREIQTDEALAHLKEAFKNNSEKLLIILLENIYEQTKENFNHEFNLKGFLMEKEKLYKDKKMNEKFLFIGFKDFEVGVNSESSQSKEVLHFEVFFRCRNSENEKEEEEFELIFTDITNIKKSEEKNAELKYKTMYLSKVAHEFKNPLICISELVSKFNEDYSHQFNNSNNLEIQKSFKNLKQIISISDYLLILMRDLDFFSQLQIQQELPIEKIEINIDDIFDSCAQMAELLLFKFNKLSNIKFILENNLINKILLITDGIKLKQVLINLISNAVKSTNSGEIKLKVDQFINRENENMVKFKVSDTGVGITEQQLQNLNQPFKQSGSESKYGSGLGLYIVNQLLQRLHSELSIESNVNEGTKISFCLPCQVEENGLEDSLTVQLSQGGNELVITDEERYIIPNEEENGEIILKHPQQEQSNIQMQPEIEREIEQVEDFTYPKYNQECSYYIVVDDEIFTLKSSIRILMKVAEKLNKKVKVFEAADGIESIYLLYKLIKKGYRIKAIVSDELMNHMNGTTSAEILKTIKNLNTDHIPFFLLTAYTEIKSNFIDCLLTKPLNTKDAEIILTYNK